MKTNARATSGVILCLVGLACTAVVAPGCRDDRTNKTPRQILPDMDDSPRWKPQSSSSFFADGRTMRQPVPGTVAFARFDVDPGLAVGNDALVRFAQDRDDLLRADPRLYFGTDGTESFLDHAPIELTREVLERGQERYNIFCAACHGYEGDSLSGDHQATVAQRWAYAPANLMDTKYSDRTQRLGKDGYLFNVIRHGVWDNWEFVEGRPVPVGNQRMPGYAHGVPERDAWAIVGYVRVLQASGLGTPTPAPVVPSAGTGQPAGMPNPSEDEPMPGTGGAQ